MDSLDTGLCSSRGINQSLSTITKYITEIQIWEVLQSRTINSLRLREIVNYNAGCIQGNCFLCNLLKSVYTSLLEVSHPIPFMNQLIHFCSSLCLIPSHDKIIYALIPRHDEITYISILLNVIILSCKKFRERIMGKERSLNKTTFVFLMMF